MVVKQWETATQEASFAPIRIIEIELGQSIFPVISAMSEDSDLIYSRVLCLVRLHTYPIGTIELALPSKGLPAQAYLPRIWEALGEKINAHLVDDAFPPINGLTPAGLPGLGRSRCVEARAQFLTTAPFVSVIIPTHDRPDRLSLCLRSLLQIEYPRYEIIVVDNVPTTDATAVLLEQEYATLPYVHYIREDRRGPSWARNSGMKAAQGSILAFVDDDVVVDPYWLVELVQAFSLSQQVACVTSLILPLKLDTASQLWFEEYGGFSKGFAQCVYDATKNRPATPLYPYNAGSFGAGASMAFTAAFLQQLGGFDPALGGAGPARGGEDLAVFFQVIKQGYKLVYQPSSLLYHLHRSDYAGLRKQMYNYGIGLTAYLTKNIVDNPLLLFDFLVRIPYGLFFLLNDASPKNTRRSTSYPRELKKLELLGMLYGPLAYVQSRKARYPLSH